MSHEGEAPAIGRPSWPDAMPPASREDVKALRAAQDTGSDRPALVDQETQCQVPAVGMKRRMARILEEQLGDAVRSNAPQPKVPLLGRPGRNEQRSGGALGEIGDERVVQ